MHKTAVTALAILTLGLAPAGALADPPPGVPPAPGTPGTVVPVAPQATPTPPPAATPSPAPAVTAPPVTTAPPATVPPAKPAVHRQHKRKHKAVHRRHKHKRHIHARAASSYVQALTPGQIQCDSSGVTFWEPGVAAYGNDIFADDQFTAHRSFLVKWNDATGTPEVVATGRFVFGFAGVEGMDGGTRWLFDGSSFFAYNVNQLYPARWTPSTHGYYAVYQQAFWDVGGSAGWLNDGAYAMTLARTYWCQI